MNKYGLLGRNISYSFSRGYFTEKFQQEGIKAEYLNFDLGEIADFPKIIKRNPDLKGLNVTIPYKEKVISFLDQISPIAKEIGAVNTIEFRHGSLIGHNTDYYGFSESLKPFLKSQHKKALILGTGGASKAVEFALQQLGINSTKVSRTAGENFLSYAELDQKLMEEHLLIVNCTPLGTFPNISDAPAIPFQHITSGHLVYDLIYNPAETQLMRLSAEGGATTANGLRMLELQAEKAWSIWNPSE